MPSSRGSNSKRFRGEILTPRRRNPDPDNRVPDEAGKSIVDDEIVGNEHGNNNNNDNVILVDELLQKDSQLLNDPESGKGETVRNDNSTESNEGNDNVQHEQISIRYGPAHIACTDEDAIQIYTESMTDDASLGLKRKYDSLDNDYNNSQEYKMNRKIKMQGLLEHRQNYLTRIRQGREAVLRRINIFKMQNPDYDFLSERDEVEQHRDLTRQVTLSTKKQQIIGGTEMQQSNTPLEYGPTPGDVSSIKQQKLSLRRGASVGRRMSAALLALAPGGSSVANASDGAPSSFAIESMEAVSHTVNLSSDATNLESSSAHLSTSQLKTSSTIHTKARNVAYIPTDKSVTSSDASSGLQHPAGFIGSNLSIQEASLKTSILGQKVIKASHHSGRNAMMSKLNNAMRSISPIIPHDNSTNTIISKTKKLKDSLHANTSRSGQFGTTSLNQTIAKEPPCPETFRLREKRQLVSRNLAALLVKREKRAYLSQRDSDSATLMKLSKKRKDDRNVFPLKGPPEPALVPGRRRTHWDVVLEEMRWMANDFVEERKWKLAISSCLGTDALELSRKVFDYGQILDSSHKRTLEVDQSNVSKNLNTPSLSIHLHRKRPNLWSSTGMSREDEVLSKAAALAISAMVFDISNRATTSKCSLVHSLFVDNKEANEVQYRIEGNPESTSTVRTSETQNQDDVLPTKCEMYQRASDYIDTVFNTLSDIDSTVSATVAGGVESHGLKLVEEQAQLISKIEQRWYAAHSGTILYGPIASGKTIITSSLIWRNRNEGPQLIICSGTRLLRWEYELNRFLSLRVLLVGETKDNLGPCDVLLCDHASVTLLSPYLLRNFVTVVVDCRYPKTYFGSDSSCSQETGEESMRNPSELLSVQWWSQLIALGVADRRGRLLLHNAGPKEDSILFQGTSKRDVLRLLAIRLAFIYGVKCFACKQLSPEKAVLSWIRFCLRKEKKARSKFENVMEFCSSLIHPVYCNTSELKPVRLDHIPWELRVVEMTKEQSLAYKTSARNVHSILSNNPCGVDHDPNALTMISNALMRLRRNCVHANLEGTLSKCKVSDYFGSTADNVLASSCLGTHREFGNVAQPSLDAAKYIIRGSNKMQHLVSFLTNEGITAHSYKQCSSSKKINSELYPLDRQEKRLKRIVILATMPEVQIMISVLLNSLGVVHELFLRPTVTSSNNHDKYELETLSWLSVQLKLWQFNRDPLRSNGVKSVVIASPLTVACNMGGLSVELADAVVCIDSDWSGKDEHVLETLFHRCAARQRMESLDGCRFIRFVSKHSCEHTFLNGRKSDLVNKRTFAHVWPTNNLGVYTVPLLNRVQSIPKYVSDWMRRSPEKGSFGFPCRNLLALRRENISDVLGSSDAFPKLVRDGRISEFLPSIDGDLKQFLFVQALIFAEDSSYETKKFVSVVPPRVWRSLYNFSRSRHIRSIAINVYFRKQTFLEEEIASIHEKTGPEITVKRNKEIPSINRLFYFGSDMSINQIRKDTVLTKRSECTESRRTNFYSKAFSNSMKAAAYNDDNMGSEGTLYCPPLFDGMLECSDMAKESVHNFQDQNLLFASDAKRRRLGGLNDSLVLTSFKDNSPTMSYVTEDESSQTDAASILNDFSDDFGLAGIGAISLPVDSSLLAATKTTEVLHNQLIETKASPWLGMESTCDFEDFEMTRRLSSVRGNQSNILLIVSRKRCRGETELLSSSKTYGGLSGSAAYNLGSGRVRTDITTSTCSYFLGNSLSPVKSKRKSVHLKGAHEPSDSNTYLPDAVMGTANLGQRVLTSLKHSSTGLTIFESELFRATSLRVRFRVFNRVLRNIWDSQKSYECGPGLPLACVEVGKAATGFRGIFHVNSSRWTSIVKRLKNREATTGGLALEVSTTQVASFRRSPLAPCRVDFGPFNAGFFSSVNGLTVVAANPPRVGISLPLGVNVIQIGKDVPPIQWSANNIEKLRCCVVKYGSNWVVASRILSGFFQTSLCSPHESRTVSIPFSARSCRDRWQYHLSDDVTNDMDGTSCERDRKIAQQVGIDELPLEVARSTPITAGNSVIFHPALHESSQFKVFHVSKIFDTSASSRGEDQTISRRRKFTAALTAKNKSIVVPIVTPVISTGSSLNIVPSHASHEEAIMTSVGVAWSGGRTEMWPIELLDIWDRQKYGEALDSNPTSNLQARPASRQQPMTSTSTQNPGVTSLHSHRGQSAVQHPPYPPIPQNQSFASTLASRPNQMRPNFHPSSSRASQQAQASRQFPHSSVDSTGRSTQPK